MSQFMDENLEINKYYIGFGIISIKNAIQLNFSCHKNMGKPYNFIESKVKMPYFLSIIGKNQYMLTKVREKYHNSIAKMTANGFYIYRK